MASIFFTERATKRPTITFLLIEAFEHQCRDFKEVELTAANQLDLLTTACEQIGMPIDAALRRDVFYRMQARGNDKVEAGPQKAVTNGHVISSYLAEMSPDQMCVLAADYNLVEARRLYCEEDFEAVQFMVAEKARRVTVDYFSLQEAVAIAFGGEPTGASKSAPPASSNVALADVSSLNNRLGMLRGVRNGA
jgi:hypothetical protein